MLLNLSIILLEILFKNHLAIIPEIIPTKIILFIKHASTNYITTNNYLKIKCESCQQHKISSNVAINMKNI